ncbi:hypothetical protein ATN84_11540 [Paramesorhizobium deserti]|uniref:Uncharacterized protein n=1 Tax=Paramesorhizobium deserti TaxID=1494590 RepID=A0A135HU07_9HYPH|nr:hypothetical protein [Paramesorhizobium deserti]KXF76669.1 hypothetical protein ATN84_11540 [Paramesorhizobium deserti]
MAKAGASRLVVLFSLDDVSHRRAKRDSYGDSDRDIIDNRANGAADANSECDSQCHDDSSYPINVATIGEEL